MPTARGRSELSALGSVATDEMCRVFNMGVGMVLVVPPADSERAISVLGEAGHDAHWAGEVTAGTGQVNLEP